MKLEAILFCSEVDCAGDDPGGNLNRVIYVAGPDSDFQ